MKSNPIQHVVNPYVVGGAIIGLKCQDAIVIGADTLLSYGSLLSMYLLILEYQDVCRFEKIT
jgi:20S proteasome alpha/beta subunit